MSAEMSVEPLFQKLHDDPALTADNGPAASSTALWNDVDVLQWQQLVEYFAQQKSRQFAPFGESLIRRGLGLVLDHKQPETIVSPQLANLSLLFHAASGADDSFRALVLNLLSSVPVEETWQEFVTLVTVTAPQTPQTAVVAMTPLFRSTPSDLIAVLFPKLADQLGQLSLAAPILDLANYYTRQGCSSVHPLRDHALTLASMLRQFTQEMLRLEERTPESHDQLVRLGQQVNDAVAIMIGLLDALALIDDNQHAAVIYPLLEIAHRRLRVEAAAALARLGESVGEESLIAMAAERAVRLTVLAYAEELGIDQRIDTVYRIPEARAEGELVAWLAEPTQFAMPPDEMSLFDQRSLNWPGYDEPVDCFLFRFGYSRDTGSFENIGISGPISKTVSSDLLDLPPQQIYALFAGLDSEHDDIYELHVESETATRHVARLLARIPQEEYWVDQPLWLGVFFEYRVLVATADRNSSKGTLIIDEECLQWYPTGNPNRPVEPEQAYAIYKGRRLLNAFNDGFTS